MASTYTRDSQKAFMVVILSPWPTMMPDRIGNIGSTQGVKASSSPAMKKAMIALAGARVSIPASSSCSETGARLVTGLEAADDSRSQQESPEQWGDQRGEGDLQQ